MRVPATLTPSWASWIGEVTDAHAAECCDRGVKTIMSIQSRIDRTNEARNPYVGNAWTHSCSSFGFREG